MARVIDKDEKALLNFQSMCVIRYLMENYSLRRADATSIWYSSRTRRYIEDNNLGWVAPARVFDELLMEKRKDLNWMARPFS